MREVVKGEFIPFIFDSVLEYTEKAMLCRFCGKPAVRDGYFIECCKEKDLRLKEIKDILDKKYEKRKAMEATTSKIKYLNRLALTGIGQAERLYTLEKWLTLAKTQENKKKLVTAAQEARTAIFEHKPCLAFSGTVGTGKTGLAISLAKELCWKKEKDFFVYRCATEEEKNSLTFTVPVLILDDLGRETGSETKIKHKRGLITDILLKRHINEKCITIITTNLTKQELVKTFGSHVCDRVFSNCLWQEFNFASWRWK